MPTQLKDLEATEISLVRKKAKPANQEARILITKVFENEIEREVGKMNMVDRIYKLDDCLTSLQKGQLQGISKTDLEISKDEAYSDIMTVAGHLRTQTPSLSQEQAIAKAMMELPNLAALAAGKPMRMVVG